jgi:hypothetical protein
MHYRPEQNAVAVRNMRNACTVHILDSGASLLCVGGRWEESVCADWQLLSAALITNISRWCGRHFVLIQETASKCRLFSTVSYEIRFRNNFRLEHVRSRLRDGPSAIHHVLTLPLKVQ